MQLTLHTDYALRVMIYLAVHGDEPASVARIAEAYAISANHLAKVAQHLASLGWIDTQRGRHGGLRLAPKAHALTVGDVVRELEHARGIVECLGDHNTCPIEPACGLKHAFRKAMHAFLEVLDGYRLADFTRKPDKVRVLLTLSARGG